MQTNRRRKLSWIEWTGIGFVLLLLAAVLFPLWPPSGKHIIDTACLSNMKHIGNMLALYAEDHDGRMPFENWMDATKAYRKNEDLLTCPIVHRSGGMFGYALNSSFVGKAMTSSGDPRKEVMAFETDALAKNVVMNLAGRNRNRHRENSSHVVYADTLARRIKAGQEP